jgi:hypothetical protein
MTILCRRLVHEDSYSRLVQQQYHSAIPGLTGVVSDRLAIDTRLDTK